MVDLEISSNAHTDLEISLNASHSFNSHIFEDIFKSFRVIFKYLKISPNTQETHLEISPNDLEISPNGSI